MLDTTIDRIGPLDQAAMEEARRHHDSLAIPKGSLGVLHEFGVRLAGITGRPFPEMKAPRCSDHGRRPTESPRRESVAFHPK